MNICNIAVGSIAMLVGIVFFFKKLDIVKSSVGERDNSPLLISKEDGTQELAAGVGLVFNIMACGAFFLGLGSILSELF